MEAVISSETLVVIYIERAITQTVTRPILTAEARSVDAGFVVDEVKPGHIPPEYLPVFRLSVLIARNAPLLSSIIRGYENGPVTPK
jgi:hypothetical protein